MNMKPNSGTTCPYTGHKDKCSAHFLDCPKWIHIQGNNPNGGQPVDKWDCADSWIPFLMIENSQMQRQTGAAVESFRNEVTKIFQQALQAIPGETKPEPKLVK